MRIILIGLCCIGLMVGTVCGIPTVSCAQPGSSEIIEDVEDESTTANQPTDKQPSQEEIAKALVAERQKLIDEYDLIMYAIQGAETRLAELKQDYAKYAARKDEILKLAADINKQLSELGVVISEDGKVMLKQK